MQSHSSEEKAFHAYLIALRHDAFWMVETIRDVEKSDKREMSERLQRLNAVAERGQELSASIMALNAAVLFGVDTAEEAPEVPAPEPRIPVRV